jgi:hypothetical protein
MKTFTDAAQTVTLIEFQKSFGRPTNTLELPGPAGARRRVAAEQRRMSALRHSGNIFQGAIQRHYVVADDS